MTKDWKEQCKKNRRLFAWGLIIIEVLVLVFYAIFLRVKPKTTNQFNQTYYPMYQDVNLMMLIGFGFLMTFIRTHSWSALVYTFFINAVVVQLYMLFQPFWAKVLSEQWNEPKITIMEYSFTAASYSVASMLIAFGALLGKVGPFELLITAVVGVFGYCLNENLVYEKIKAFDAGGSTAIHTFGAFYGIIISFFLGRVTFCRRTPPTNANSNTFAMIGTVFLWMYWPSFNAGYFPTSGFERSLIISNTILSLTGSCLGCFVVTSTLRDRFSMEDILNASLAGGVIIGAPCGLALNPAASLAIGFLAGILSTVCFARLTEKMYTFIGVHDTCGVNNLHGLPGFFGGIVSAIVIGSHNVSNFNQDHQTVLPWSPDNNVHNRSFSEQAAAQIAATFISAGMGIFVGILGGLIVSCFYNVPTDKYFFNDEDHFETETDQLHSSHKVANESVEQIDA